MGDLWNALNQTRRPAWKSSVYVYIFCRKTLFIGFVYVYTPKHEPASVAGLTVPDEDKGVSE